MNRTTSLKGTATSICRLTFDPLKAGHPVSPERIMGWETKKISASFPWKFQIIKLKYLKFLQPKFNWMTLDESSCLHRK